MDIKKIQELVKFIAKSGVNEVEIEEKGFRIVIKTSKETKDASASVQAITPQMLQAAMQMQNQPAPIQQPAQQQAQPAAKTENKPKEDESGSDESKFKVIKAPMIGTFYRRPSPDKDLFVKVGQEISKGDTVCIIEAMKLFNEIESEYSGKIVKILVEDESPVEYDQPLFLIDPS
jgi:acetyl-CoA carboxylase biotin carboxyl carrier protein